MPRLLVNCERAGAELKFEPGYGKTLEAERLHAVSFVRGGFRCFEELPRARTDGDDGGSSSIGEGCCCVDPPGEVQAQQSTSAEAVQTLNQFGRGSQRN
ncbi:unnamed protein product [Amoebophrya sp. A25]|nr:unnamed protein product [Amoebophrya sp. A25]|eukprot:GSA25T00016503001.1